MLKNLSTRQAVSSVAKNNFPTLAKDMSAEKPHDESTIGMKAVDILIVLFWLFLLWDAYSQGLELPGLMSEIDLPELPVIMSAFAILVIAGSASFVTFWQRKNIMEDMPFFSTLTDRALGSGAYRRFTHRLRPVCVSMLSSLVLATVGLYCTYEETQDRWSYAICFGFLAFAVCMFIAYLVSKRLPPVLR